ncbi:MAG: potassium channel family protein [Alphaproteobacteria bacterium]|nr:potassium channel family protein [Alphaproteobacteria bacterium]
MLMHGVPWQSALAGAFQAILVFIILSICSVVVGYYGIHYILLSLLLTLSFIIIIGLIPLFLNLSREFFSKIFILFVFQVFITILSFALLHMDSGVLDGGIVNKTFKDCLYFSITTFTTLGYGDFQPRPDMRLATSMEALFGMVSMALGASLIWLWCQENLLPKEKALFDGYRRKKGSITIHRMRIRTIMGGERHLPDYEIPIPGQSFRYDDARNEWIKLKEGDVLKEGDSVVEPTPKDQTDKNSRD